MQIVKKARATPPVAAEPAATADGHEIEMLDSLLPTLHPRARAGDEAAIDHLLRVLDLRLKYVRLREVKAERAAQQTQWH